MKCDLEYVHSKPHDAAGDACLVLHVTYLGLLQAPPASAVQLQLYEDRDDVAYHAHCRGPNDCVNLLSLVWNEERDCEAAAYCNSCHKYLGRSAATPPQVL